MTDYKYKSGLDPAKHYPHLKLGTYFGPREPYVNEKRLDVQRRWMKAQR
jgi:hypothetical protein